ncbi:response regulator [Pseudenhygromyxa sp. WMMC2535]|uniref:response regulator n=1 Tax=Pseudenhygromyxa sp. WMMC2535 TaxID=2712867 RepID=UPI001554D5B3|nr:response regulator [Pseudenhygromyxa sp. WMMC2535]NVB38862.1 response regulator [Pseudenhygromyxa sp. WMMC2535]
MQSTSAPIPLRRAGSGSQPAGLALSSSSAALRIDLRPRVLIVDDCRFIAERLARTFEARGYETQLAGDGLAALAAIEAEDFDMFVLDIDIPCMDGFKVLRSLRLEPAHASAPVLMLGASNSQADRIRAVALGANGYLAKPLQIGPLHAMLDSLSTLR